MMMKSCGLTLLMALAATAHPMLPELAQHFDFSGKNPQSRRLDGHDAIMEAGMKCMPSCDMLMSMMQAMGDGDKDAVCKGYACIVENKDGDCADLHKLLADPPEGGMLPKGLFQCVCDAGCNVFSMMGGDRRLDAHQGGGGMPDLNKMCPVANCVMTSDECKPVLEMVQKGEAEDEEGGAGMMDLVGCACKEGNTEPINNLMEIFGDAKGHPDCGEFTADDQKEAAFVCKVAADGATGACAKTMLAAKTVFDDDADCKVLGEEVYKTFGDQEAEGLKCLDEIATANAPPPADDASSSANFRAALPSFGFLLLGLLSLVR